MLLFTLFYSCSGPTWNLEGDIDTGEECAWQFWYSDADGDGYGSNENFVKGGCEAPVGYIDIRADCDDSDPSIYPGAMELCDGIDSNCGGDSMDVGLATFFPANGGTPEPITFDGSVLTLDRSGTLNLCPWRHKGQLSITAEDVTVRGVWGSSLTTLDGGSVPIKDGGTKDDPEIKWSDTESVVKTTASNTYITGVTITGGNSTKEDNISIKEDNISIKGGGVNCGGSSASVTLENVVVTGNTAEYGGGVAADFGCQLEFYNVLVSDNTAIEYGGGVYLFNAKMTSDRLDLMNNTVRSQIDFAGLGGGIYAEKSLIQGFSLLEVEGNEASFTGGGLYLIESIFCVPYLHVEDNYALFGGGLFLSDSVVDANYNFCLPAYAKHKPHVNNSISIVGNAGFSSGGLALLGSSAVKADSLLVQGSVGYSGLWVDDLSSVIWSGGGLYDSVEHGGLIWTLGATPAGGDCSEGTCTKR